MSTQETEITEENSDLNLDPITGEPGAHPVGTGVGAAAGGATGAAIGAIAGPLGAAVGTVIGALAGGFAGKSVAEVVDPTAEDAFWRANHANQFYAGDDYTFDDYADAYRVGYAGFEPGKSFEEKEADLQLEYEGGPQKAIVESSDEPSTGSNPDSSNSTVSIPEIPSKEHNHSPFPWLMAREAARAAYDRIAGSKKPEISREKN